MCQRQHQRLTRWVLRVVRRRHQNVRRFEELGEHRRRVRQPAVRERIGGQQIAELIVNGGLAYTVEEPITCGQEKPDEPTEQQRGGRGPGPLQQS